MADDGLLDARGVEDGQVGVEDGGVDDGAVAGEDGRRGGNGSGKGEFVRLGLGSKACRNNQPRLEEEEMRKEPDAPIPTNPSLSTSFLCSLSDSRSGTSQT